jgi:integrase
MTIKRRPDALINRSNWRDTRAFVRYCVEVKQNGERTVESVRLGMDHLLRWATDTSLLSAPEIRPVLPAYMDALDIKPAYRNKMLEYARAFFMWAREEDERYSKIKKSWVDSLHSKQAEPDLVEKTPVFTLEMVRAITALTPRTLAEERDIAAVAMLFLSGMRDGAFCTLPLRSVDWSQDPVLVRQWPSWGVKTKKRKAANTYLLPNEDLDDLRAIARAWQEKMKPIIKEKGMFYTLIDPISGEISADQAPGEHRSSNLARRLRKLCERAGIEYASPHRIRHGHVVYAMSFCTSMDELKAVSQNVMHESVVTTESIYGDLPSDTVALTLKAMSRRKPGEDGSRLADSLFQSKVRTRK